MSHLGSIER